MHLLLAPPSAPERSGGSIYNSRIAAVLSPRGTLEYRRVRTDGLGSMRGEYASYLFDSLYLGERDFARTLEELRQRGKVPLGVLAHLLPSMLPRFAQKERPPNVAAREAAALALFDYAVAPSTYVARTLEEREMSRKAIRVLRPGVDMNPGGARPRDEVNLLLTVAHFTDVKNLDCLVGPLERLARLEWQWVILGDTKVEPATFRRFEAAVKKSSIGDRVRAVGSVDEREVRWWLSRASVFLLPSRFETYGLAAAEALAAGCPVVANRVGGTAEVVPDGHGGFLLEPENEAQWTKTIATLLSDRVVLEEARAAALAHGARLPRWEETADALEAFLAEVAP